MISFAQILKLLPHGTIFSKYFHHLHNLSFMTNKDIADKLTAHRSLEDDSQQLFDE